MKLFKEVSENDGVHYEALSPAELAKQATENRRKAEAWDKAVDCVTRSKAGIKLWAEKYLRAQLENPPKEEGNDEEEA